MAPDHIAPDHIARRIPVLEIGGTHAVGAVVDTGDWSIHARSRVHVDARADAATILDAFASAGRDAAGVADRDAPWGVAMPDPFDYDTGIARFRDVGKYEALDGFDVGTGLAQRLGAETLVFCNDADAFVLGEWVRGQAGGHRRCVGITLGTGLGSGWIVDGRIVTDEPGVPPLGRARTIVLDGIGLEEIASTRGIRRRFTDAGGDATLDVKEICELAGAGDQVAARAIEATFIDLGRGLRGPLREFRADVVVVGGSMARSWDLFSGPFDRGLDWRDHPPIRVAADGEDAGLRGAARAASARRPA